MLGQGISIPSLQGIANLKPHIVGLLDTFSVTGQQWLRTDLVPEGKLWQVAYSSFGFNSGDVSDCLYEIEDSVNTRVAVLSMQPDLAAATTIDLTGGFWVNEGKKLGARFDVTTVSPTCWLTVTYLEFVTGGY